jgi:hypothetical protein
MEEIYKEKENSPDSRKDIKLLQGFKEATHEKMRSGFEKFFALCMDTISRLEK